MPADRAPAVLVCLLGPPRQHSAGLSRASHGQLSTGCCCSSYGHSVLPGQHCEDAAMCCCGASLDAGSSSTRLADLCLCADAPRAVASVCWPQTGSLLVATAAGTKAVPPSPHRPAASPAHPAAGLPHTRAAVPLAPGTQGGQRADPTLREEKGSNPTQSLCTAQTALSSTSARRDDSLSSHDLPGSLHSDAPPHASLRVILTAC